MCTWDYVNCCNILPQRLRFGCSCKLHILHGNRVVQGFQWGNSLDKLRHPRSEAYSAEQQIWYGGAYPDCYLKGTNGKNTVNHIGLGAILKTKSPHPEHRRRWWTRQWSCRRTSSWRSLCLRGPPSGRCCVEVPPTPFRTFKRRTDGQKLTTRPNVHRYRQRPPPCHPQLQRLQSAAPSFGSAKGAAGAGRLAWPWVGRQGELKIAAGLLAPCRLEAYAHPGAAPIIICLWIGKQQSTEIY